MAVVQGVLVPNHDNTNNNKQSQQQQQHIYDHKNATHGVGAPETTTLPPHQSIFNDTDDDDGHWIKGEVQPRRCNDVIFAILFILQLCILASVAVVYTPQMIHEVVANNGYNNMNGDRNLLLSSLNNNYNNDMLNDDEEEGSDKRHTLGMKFASGIAKTTNYYVILLSNNDKNHFHYDSVAGGDENRDLEEENYNNDNDVTGTNDMGDMMTLLGISALISLAISTTALSVMISHAQTLIKFALLFNITLTAVFAIGSMFLSPFAAITGIFLFVLTVYYAYVVWGRIPFAACNLVSATTAVRANLGLAFFAYNSLFIMIGWSAWWLVSFVSTVYITSGCDGQGNCEKEPSSWLVFAMFLSYHWTYQVIKNVVHVTVSGTVGTWWFVPTDGSSFCSRGVRDSFLRSITTSFGSICMGSLLVAIIEAAKNMVRNLRESEDGGGVLLCLAECLLACLQDIMEYFNLWAFVFVGLYGYTFLEAGKNVLNLFKTRGWTTIITDTLAQSVLQMMSVSVGLITGLVSLAIAHGRGMVFGDELGASAAAFFLGFIIGAVLTSTLMTLVSSAVNTVIVCYAEAPREFEMNHPQLSGEMRAAWKQAWPTEFHY